MLGFILERATLMSRSQSSMLLFLVFTEKRCDKLCKGLKGSFSNVMISFHLVAPSLRVLLYLCTKDHLLEHYKIPRSYTATKQNRASSAAGPSIWNDHPLEFRSLPRDFSSSFYSLLKTFLCAWAGSASE